MVTHTFNITSIFILYSWLILALLSINISTSTRTSLDLNQFITFLHEFRFAGALGLSNFKLPFTISSTGKQFDVNYLTLVFNGKKWEQTNLLAFQVPLGYVNQTLDPHSFAYFFFQPNTRSCISYVKALVLTQKFKSQASLYHGNFSFPSFHMKTNAPSPLPSVILLDQFKGMSLMAQTTVSNLVFNGSFDFLIQFGKAKRFSLQQCITNVVV